MIGLLFGSTVKKIATIGVVMALLFGWFQIRGCIRMKEQLRQYEQAEKIRQQDEKTDDQMEKYKDEVDEFDSPDDIKSGFDRLRHYGR